jgi:hypothetical protein
LAGGRASAIVMGDQLMIRNRRLALAILASTASLFAGCDNSTSPPVAVATPTPHPETLSWYAVALTNLPNTKVVGYKIHIGVVPQTYTSTVDVGNTTSWTITGLAPDRTYWAVVKAYNAAGVESGPSNEIQFTTAPSQAR